MRYRGWPWSRHPTRNAAYASTSPAVADFSAGQMIRIDSGANMASAVIATVGTAGATTVSTANTTGATLIPVASRLGFTAGQTITITLAAPLARAHATVKFQRPARPINITGDGIDGGIQATGRTNYCGF